MTCPNCGSQIEQASEAFKCCPHCGHPLVSPSHSHRSREDIRPELMTTCLLCTVATILSAVFQNFFLTCIFGAVALVCGSLGLFGRKKYGAIKRRHPLRLL